MSRKGFFILLLAILISCSNSNDCDCESDSLSLTELYNKAVIDAITIEDDEIISTLTAVTDSNSKLITMGSGDDKWVLVCTWTAHYSSYKINDTMTTTWGETWITLAPELQNKLNTSAFTNDSTRNLRINQLLGLPPENRAKKFVEFWIKPQDLFRPAYDNEITDNTCGKYFPSNIDTAYINWFEANIISSYFPAPNYTKYPWTRLGYTYDWGNPNSEVGLSEFVAKTNSKIIIKNVYTAEEYLK